MNSGAEFTAAQVARWATRVRGGNQVRRRSVISANVTSTSQQPVSTFALDILGHISDNRALEHVESTSDQVERDTNLDPPPYTFDQDHQIHPEVSDGAGEVNSNEPSSGHINIDLQNNDEDGGSLFREDILPTSPEDPGNETNPGDTYPDSPPDSSESLNSSQPDIINNADECNNSDASSGHTNVDLENDDEGGGSLISYDILPTSTENPIMEGQDGNSGDIQGDLSPYVPELEECSHPGIIRIGEECDNNEASSGHINVDLENDDEDGGSTSSDDTEDTIIEGLESNSSTGDAETSIPPSSPQHEDPVPEISHGEDEINPENFPGHIQINLQQESENEGSTNLEDATSNSTDDESNAAEAETASQEKYQSSLVPYLHIMYCACMWPHDVKLKEGHWLLKSCQWVLHKICCMLSLVLVMRLLKWHAFAFLSGEGELDKFVAFAFHSVQTCSKLYFMWLYTAHHKKFFALLKRFAEMEYDNIAKNHLNKINWRVGTGLGITTITLSFVFSFFWFYEFDWWKLDLLININTYKIIEFATLWNPHTYETLANSTWYSIYNYDNSERWSVGIFGLVSNIFGQIQDYLMCDVTLLITLSISQAMNHFISKVKRFGRQTNYADKLWQDYEYMKTLTMEINNLLGAVLLLTHINNALLISHCLMEGLNQDRSISTILHTLTAAKVLIIYYIACKLSAQNKYIREWFKDLCGDGRLVQVGGKRRFICVLLDDESINRIGLGSNDFFIDQRFVITFVTVVSTFFMMLAEFRDTEMRS